MDKLITQISPIDSRDYIPSTVNEQLNTSLPDKFMPDKKQQVFCQWLSSTCVANALVTMLQYCEQKAGLTPNNYSRGFIYANRNGEDINVSGMYPRKALKILQKEGVCSYYNFRWGQSSLKRTLKKFEPLESQLEEDAKQYIEVDSYYKLNSFEELKTAIYNNGAAIISIPVFMPYLFIQTLNPKEDYSKKSGNHCIAAIGWDGDYIICQDSYGFLTGKNGIIKVHKDYKINEMWSIKLKSTERPSIIPTSEEKYLGYIKYIFKWLLLL